MWADDTELLQGVFDSRDNLSYYLPYWRALNDSHCSNLISFAGSEIQEDGMGLEDFVGDLLNPDRALRSFKESVQPGEDVE
jgi:hypothetical protein